MHHPSPLPPPPPPPPGSRLRVARPTIPRGVIARIWQTSLHADRLGEYDSFARERSLPMFQSQDGLLGVLLLGEGTERRVLTLWRDETAIDALESSESYRATVAALIDTGILVPDSQSTVLHAVTGGWAHVA
jgi:heme-degrading monooxygenase HmoA